MNTMITFNSAPIFGSASVRTRREPRGEQLASRASLGFPGGGSVPTGGFDFGITFTGRLITDTPAQLHDMLESIIDVLTSPPARNELVDAQGNIWPEMSFVRFEPLGPMERGRVCSMPFTARFVGLHD